MSETSAPATPGSAGSATPSPAAADPLAGAWSQGLPGPRRPHGIRAPALLALNGTTPDPAPAESAPPADIPAQLPESAPTPWSEAVPSDAVADADWESAVPSSPPAANQPPPEPPSAVELTSPPETPPEPAPEVP